MRRKLTLENIAKLKAQAYRYEVIDTDISGFRLRVTPNGVMTYSVVYRVNGKQVRYTIGKHGDYTTKKARDIAKDKLADIHKGEDPQAQKLAARRKAAMPTLSEFLKGDFTDMTLHQRSQDKTLKRISGVFGNDLGDTPLDQITAWNLKKVRAKRLKAGIQPATLNRDFAAIGTLFSHAVQAGYIQQSPLMEIEDKERWLEVDHHSVVRYLTHEEERRLRRALIARETVIRRERKSANTWRRKRSIEELHGLSETAFADHLRPMVLLSMNTGLRRGELFKLEWANVDLGKRLLSVVGTTSKRLKTRHIPLNAEALEVLSGWQAQQPDTEGLVFPSEDGKPFDNIKKSWGAVLVSADIQRFRWHDLRHHFASWLVMKGVDLNTVRDLLGHGDIKMTLRYAHLAPEHKADAVARLVTK